MTTEQSIEIDRPIADVFRFTTEHVAEWSEVVVSDEVIHERPGGEVEPWTHCNETCRS